MEGLLGHPLPVIALQGEATLTRSVRASEDDGGELVSGARLMEGVRRVKDTRELHRSRIVKQQEAAFEWQVQDISDLSVLLRPLKRAECQSLRNRIRFSGSEGAATEACSLDSFCLHTDERSMDAGVMQEALVCAP